MHKSINIAKKKQCVCVSVCVLSQCSCLFIRMNVLIGLSATIYLVGEKIQINLHYVSLCGCVRTLVFVFTLVFPMGDVATHATIGTPLFMGK